MATTMTFIASVTVPAGLPTSIDFTSIPATYTDLKVIFSTREGYAGNNINVNGRFNGLSTGIYSRIYLYGNNDGAPSGASNSGTAETVQFYGYTNANTATSNTFGSCEYYIGGYTTANFKPISADSASEGTSSDQNISTIAGLASTTAAITSLSFSGTGTGWIQGSTAYLYGIKNS
jgi:hypothetical protein